MLPEITESPIECRIRTFFLRQRWTLLLLAVTFLCGCGEESAQKRDQERAGGKLFQGESELVLADLERLTIALYANDLDMILAMTHPKVIEQMGGPAQAQVLLRNSLERIQASGVLIESCSFPEKPTFAETGTHQFAVVPVKIIVSANGQRRESLHCQVGVRVPGATNWTYIEGSQLRAFFPEFPSNVPLPELKQSAVKALSR
jgi:hypothetical protein